MDSGTNPASGEEGYRGILLVISSPSGGGKGTLIRHLLQSVPGVGYSVSWTTRAPRPGAAPGLAVWAAYSGHDPQGNQAWFDWRDGRIVVKNPDQEILAKMRQVAAHFRARVMGDDGEEY